MKLTSRQRAIAESITFSYEAAQAGGACDACGKIYAPSGWTEIDQDNIKCNICYDMGKFGDDYDVNVANSNAMLILNMLNIEFDYAGSIDPATLGISIDNQGIKPAARHINMGVDENRIRSYLTRLKRLAEKALEEGSMITWG